VGELPRQQGGFVITCPSVTRDRIQFHYDLLTPFYRVLWGPHIHHGLWPTGVETGPLREAQLRLIDRLVAAARLSVGDKVLDVGCGMGGTSIVLAQRLRCQVMGLTLSPLQRTWAGLSAHWHGVAERTRFRRANAEAVKLAPGSFDVVWNVECSEHLFDKPGYFRRATEWLRPGGRVAVCAWLAGEGAEVSARVLEVCEGCLCPSLGTAADYQGWMDKAGLTPCVFEDLTTQVAPTWEIGLRYLQQSGLLRLRWLFDRATVRFADTFAALAEAYRTGAMRYGLFVAEKPGVVRP
jgi:tocopherol O-methyltransferase